ncbi:MAG: hypothetical protein K1V87_03250 [Muribaculum sp.]
MTVCWTSTDFLLQWMWVALIVVCAVILAVRHLRKSWRRAHSGKAPQCAGCPLSESCEKDDARLLECAAKNDNGGSGCCGS